MAASDAELTSPLLVAYDERFLDAAFGWLNDPEIMALVRGRPFTRDAQRAWFESLPERDDYSIWGIEADHQPIGAVGVKNVNDNSGELFIYLGDRAYWGSGLGARAIRQMLELLPGSLHRIWLEVGADNARALGLYRRLGFTEVDRREDLVVMELIR